MGFSQMLNTKSLNDRAWALWARYFGDTPASKVKYRLTVAIGAGVATWLVIALGSAWFAVLPAAVVAIKVFHIYAEAP